MAVQATEEIREIVDFAPEGFLVTSFYVNTDGAEFQSETLLNTSFDSIVHTAESKRKEIEGDLSHEGRESIRADLEKIRAFFCDQFDRTDTNGLAMFSCSAQDFWEVIQMPEKVDSRVEFGPRPYLSPIAAFLSHNKPTAVLLTDKQHARIFTMKAGEVREWTDFEDFVPQRSTQGGWSQMRYQRRSDEWKKHHLDRAADLTFKLLQHYPFQWLILGTEVQDEADLKQDLHPYLKDRLIGQIHVRIDAGPGEIVEQARTVREQAESRYIDDLIGRIQEYAGAGGRGTIGIGNTIQALNEQKIHILLVQTGYTHPGAVCPSCGVVSHDQVERCPACREPATKVDDVVELMIQRALELGSEVEVATEQDKLAPIKSIGSILYY
jgi:peptide subunit release factor 1 (eRF1)